MDGDDGGSQIRFRVVCRRRRGAGGGEDDPGRCGTAVKVEPLYMREFGIREGDIVKISGGAKSTAAICLPMSDSEMREADEPEMEVEFLNDPGRRARRYPGIILCGPVSCNVDTSAEWQPTVCLGKFPKPEAGSDDIPEAEVVTLGTFGMTERVMPGYRSNLDHSRVTGFVVTRGDRIDIPFQKEWIKKVRQDLQEGQELDAPAGRPGRKRPRAPPPFRGLFQSVVTDVKPGGMPFWVITENTRFEFKDGGLRGILDLYVHPPRNLAGVIPISRKITVGDTEITLASLEAYPDTMKIIWYSHRRTKIPESDFVDAHTMRRMSRMMHNDGPRLVFALKDDLGNRYANVSGGGGGGSSGPDPVAMEMVSDFSWHSVFSPGLDAGAREIILTIKEVWWVKQDIAATEWLPPPTGHPRGEPVDYQPPPKVVVAEGPWRFSIPISRQDG